MSNSRGAHRGREGAVGTAECGPTAPATGEAAPNTAEAHRTKDTNTGVRALSLWQPWASLIAAGVKQVETRHWYTAYRGPIVIHAAKKLVSECGEELDEICLDEFGCEWRRTLPRGAIVAMAALRACERMIHPVYPTPEGYPSRTEYTCGNWQPGRFGWLLDDIKELKRPIPYRGMQGLFTVPDGVLAHV